MRRFACIPALLLALAQAHAQNGIAVGKPKVFDNRSLTIMMQELNARLQNTTAVDQAALTKSLGLTQGFERQDVSQTFGVTASPPATAAPSASALPAVAASPAYTPNFGQSADDLLADQVQLTYQIFNLRMLLERSLTDRLIDRKPRRQAVISFSVTLDPTRQSRDSAAYVEIKVRSGRGNIPVSLVALMPQEKTYNSVALSSKATAFNGAAVAKLVSVQYAAQRSSQTFFLFRDSDTLALEVMHPGEQPTDDLTFGWEFRPVLGHRSVPSGTRQVFAVISLPANDEPTNLGEERLHVTARTFWRHYDHKSLTTDERRSWNPFTASLPGDAFFDLGNVSVPSTSEIQSNLGPKISRIAWTPTSTTTGVAQIDGQNFFAGTTITLGGTTYSGANDGLTIKSDQTMILNTPVANVVLGNGVVSGRYGPTAPLVHQNPILAEGLMLSSEVRPHGMQFSNVLLFLSRRNGTPYHEAELAGLTPPLVLLNGVPVSGVTAVTEQAKGSGAQAAVSLTLPNSVAKTLDAEYRVVFPFAGQGWSASIYNYDDSEVEITRLGGGECTTLLLTSHQEFEGDWKLILDKTYSIEANPPPCPPPAPASATPAVPGKSHRKKGAALVPKPKAAASPAALSLTRPQACTAQNGLGCYNLEIRAASSLLASFKKLVLLSNDGVAVPLDIPSGTPKAIAPSIDGPSKDPLYLHEVRAVVFTGRGLDGVKKVLFDRNVLPFTVNSDGTKISVVVNRDVTAHSGQMTLVFQLDGGASVIAPLTVLAAPR